MQYVLAVQAAGSISGAAREMSISQSSILAAIGLAEEDLGARIFDRRKGRGIVITAAGERYLAAAGRLLKAEREFRHNLRTSTISSGPLRIGCFAPFGSIMMIDVLRNLRERFGFFEVTLIETDQVSLKRALDRGEIDVAVVYDLGPDFDCAIEVIGRAPPHAMVHVDSPLAVHDEISINDLIDTPISLLNLPLTTTYLMTLFDFADRKPMIGFRSSHYETVIRAVGAGFGPTVLNIWPVTRLPSETNTRRIRIREPLPAPSIVTADRYGDQKPPNLVLFLEELRKYVARTYYNTTDAIPFPR